MKVFLRIGNIEIEKIINKTLDTLLQFTTPSGLFKTFRVDYSEKECPNDYINEENATIIYTKLDHSFILDIILKLRKYFTDTNKFLEIVGKGLKLVIDDAIINNFDGHQTLKWKYYNIDHQGQGKIHTDIDDTGRNLIFIERCREVLGDIYIKNLMSKCNIINNPYNYRQFWKLLHPLNGYFKPDKNIKNPEFFGLLTYFGNKENNDVDPVCNITAIYSTLLFFNKNFLYITKDDIINIKKILDYLFSFLNSDICTKTHEYYEPIVVFYNYCKLIKLCENLQPPLRNLIDIENIKSRLLHLILNELKQGKWKNPLEKAFGVSSLIILGYRRDNIENEVIDIIENQKNGYYWEAFRFYRQRHPHRIFGSRGLTTAVCLEALNYWKSCCL